MRKWENKLQKMLDCPPPTTTTTTTPAPTTTTTQPPTTTTTQPSGYVVPEEFGWIDSYDYLTDYPADDHYLNHYLDYYPNYFDVGDVITLSTRCTNDFDFGAGRSLRSSAVAKCVHDPSTGYPQEDWDDIVRYMCSENPADILHMAMVDPTNPNEYLTFLNCPQCGCTLGENDAVHMDSDRSNIWQPSNARSAKKFSEMIPRHPKKSKNNAEEN